MKNNESAIQVKTPKGQINLRPDDIIRLEAFSNYTFIYFSGDRRVLTSKVLKQYASKLIPHGFLRTHQTHLVNPKYISCITHDNKVLMTDTSVVYMSRRMKKRVMESLQHACA